MSYKDPDKQREYYRQYRSVNRERLDELNRKWFANNKEQRKQYYQQYYQANREQINARRKMKYRQQQIDKFNNHENTNDNIV